MAKRESVPRKRCSTRGASEEAEGDKAKQISVLRSQSAGACGKGEEEEHSSGSTCVWPLSRAR